MEIISQNKSHPHPCRRCKIYNEGKFAATLPLVPFHKTVAHTSSWWWPTRQTASSHQQRMSLAAQKHLIWPATAFFLWILRERLETEKKKTANYLVALKLVIEPYVLGGKHRSRASPWPEPGWSLSTTMAPVSWVLSTSGRGVSELKQ